MLDGKERQMSDVNTVTIPLEEYIELRRKADENFYLVDRLGQMDARMFNMEQKVFDMERRLAHE